MAKDRAIKSIIAAMKSMSAIQQQKQKILINRLENDQSFQNTFMQNVMKSKIQSQQKRMDAPFELEQKWKEKQIVSPESQARIDVLKERPTESVESTVKRKVMKSGVGSLTSGELDIWKIIKGQNRRPLPTKRASKITQKRLLRDYLSFLRDQAPETRGIEKLGFIQSKRELIDATLIGQGKHKSSRDLFKALGVSNQDFYDWALRNSPVETQVAFPERTR